MDYMNTDHAIDKLTRAASSFPSVYTGVIMGSVVYNGMFWVDVKLNDGVTRDVYLLGEHKSIIDLIGPPASGDRVIVISPKGNSHSGAVIRVNSPRYENSENWARIWTDLASGTL